MLYSLHVKNLALIDEIEIDFTGGLNILTGETGAGKSVLIGSVNLALGEKSDASMIRDGAESALIEMTFGDLDEETLDTIRAMDIHPEADGQLILQRRLYPQRSVCKVSGESVTLRQLRELARYLINIHGQNEQQTLLVRHSQTEILDTFGADKVAPVKAALSENYRALREKEKERDEGEMDEAARQRETDLICYEIQEIDNAALKEGEDETLEETFRRLSSAQRITEGLSGAFAALEEDDGGALNAVGSALRSLHETERYDSALHDLTAQIADAESLLRDAAGAIRERIGEVEHGAQTLDEVTDRLNLINRLKDKYDAHHGGISAILAYRDKKEARLKTLNDYETYRKGLLAECDRLKKDTLTQAHHLSALRKQYGKDLSARLTEALKGLNFADVRMEVEVEQDETRLSANGCDRVSFLISLNPGESLRPLEKIASGGELSRIMLGLQTVLTGDDAHPALVFDEIDAGISGRTAWAVSQKLMTLSAARQVICITHLAQIAAMADTHYMIYKDTEGGRSVTRIRRLTEDETVAEMARLMGTDEVSDQALQGAQKMRTEALALKKA